MSERASSSSFTRRRQSRPLSPAPRTFSAYESAKRSGWRRSATLKFRWSAGTAACGSATSARRSPVGGGSTTAKGAGLPRAGTASKNARARAERLGGLDVARDREEGVPGRVVRRVEAARVVERRGAEVVHRADDGVLVGEGVVRERVGRLEGRRVRLVVDPEPLLLLHGLALVVELLLREDERAHPVGLEEEAEVEALGRERLVVVRPVLGRRAVHRAARGGHEPEVLALPDVLGALEHEVLEEVGEARLSRKLDAAADVVRDVDRDEGDAALGRDDDGQAVREAFDVRGDLEVQGNGTSRCPAARGPRNIRGCLEGSPPHRPRGRPPRSPGRPRGRGRPAEGRRVPPEVPRSRPCSTTTSRSRTATRASLSSTGPA